MKIDIEFNSGAQLPMDAIPDLARAAEAHGFDCAWGGEANNKDPTVMLSAIAAVTTRLKIGSAIYHILGRTPATLALQAVGLDELSTGRFLLGIGSSNPTIAKWHGQSFDRPLRRGADQHGEPDGNSSDRRRSQVGRAGGWQGFVQDGNHLQDSLLDRAEL